MPEADEHTSLDHIRGGARASSDAAGRGGGRGLPWLEAEHPDQVVGPQHSSLVTRSKSGSKGVQFQVQVQAPSSSGKNANGRGSDSGVGQGSGSGTGQGSSSGAGQRVSLEVEDLAHRADGGAAGVGTDGEWGESGAGSGRGGGPGAAHQAVEPEPPLPLPSLLPSPSFPRRPATASSLGVSPMHQAAAAAPSSASVTDKVYAPDFSSAPSTPQGRARVRASPSAPPPQALPDDAPEAGVSGGWSLGPPAQAEL